MPVYYLPPAQGGVINKHERKNNLFKCDLHEQKQRTEKALS